MSSFNQPPSEVSSPGYRYRIPGQSEPFATLVSPAVLPEADESVILLVNPVSYFADAGAVNINGDYYPITDIDLGNGTITIQNTDGHATAAIVAGTLIRPAFQPEQVGVRNTLSNEVTALQRTNLSFSSVAALKDYAEFAALANGATARVLGYYGVGDQGYAEYVWSPTSTAAEDPANVIRPTLAGSGRWIRASLKKEAEKVYTFDTIDDLKAFQIPSSWGIYGEKFVATVLGYYAAGDGGGGSFWFDAANNESEIKGIRVQPTAGSGRWFRIKEHDYVSPFWCGAIANGDAVNAEADTSAIEAANLAISVMGTLEIRLTGAKKITKYVINRTIHIGSGHTKMVSNSKTFCHLVAAPGFTGFLLSITTNASLFPTGMVLKGIRFISWAGENGDFENIQTWISDADNPYSVSQLPSGVAISSAQALELVDCWFIGLNKGISTETVVDGSVVPSDTKLGLDCQIKQTFMVKCGTGLYVQRSFTGLVVESPVADVCRRTLHFENLAPSDSVRINSLRVEGRYFDYNSDEIVYIDNCPNAGFLFDSVECNTIDTVKSGFSLFRISANPAPLYTGHSPKINVRLYRMFAPNGFVLTDENHNGVTVPPNAATSKASELKWNWSTFEFGWRNSHMLPDASSSEASSGGDRMFAVNYKAKAAENDTYLFLQSRYAQAFYIGEFGFTLIEPQYLRPEVHDAERELFKFTGGAGAVTGLELLSTGATKKKTGIYQLDTEETIFHAAKELTFRLAHQKSDGSFENAIAGEFVKNIATEPPTTFISDLSTQGTEIIYSKATGNTGAGLSPLTYDFTTTDVYGVQRIKFEDPDISLLANKTRIEVDISGFSQTGGLSRLVFRGQAVNFLGDTIITGDGTYTFDVGIGVSSGIMYIDCQNDESGNTVTATIDRISLIELYPPIQGRFGPGADDEYQLGTASLRWKEVFAANGTINTSDAREKTEVRSLTANELNAAKQLSKEIGVFKWLASVDAKGESAREHIGMTVQRAIEIMEANDLSPFAYGFICYDEWAEETICVKDEEVNPETQEVISEAVYETRPAGNRFGFRYDQLMMFIARGIEARLEALENV